MFLCEVNMPELPEVETIKNALIKAIDKANIISVRVFNNRFRKIIPDDFAKRIEGSQIIMISRRAKYLIITLNNGLSIIWHLGMSGKIKIFDNLPQKLEKHDHVIIETDKCFLVYNDARRFGMLEYVETANLEKNPIFTHIGIEPFDKKLNGLFLFNKLKNKKIPIKVALLDQSIINGIGNIYASEALFDAGISPLRNSDDLTQKECETLVRSVQKILQKAIEAGGSSIHDYKKPDGSLGYFQNMHCVYNKTGQKCPLCTCDVFETGGIKKITQAGRSTFYCAVKQK